MHTLHTKSLFLILFILSMQASAYAEDFIEGTRVTLQEVCLNDHAFAVIIGGFGSSMVQIYEAAENKSLAPQPKHCEVVIKKEEKSSFFSW